MSVATRVRSAAVRVAGPDDPNSFAGRARARRWNEFIARFPQIEEMRVLDLGGTPRFWRAASRRPARVTLLNLIREEADEDWIDSREGDATVPLTGEAFDLVFSNSLIEHLPADRRAALADVAMTSADHCWIQTPNRRFPIEPHWLFPFAQYLGAPARRWLAHNWPASHFVGMPPEVVEQEIRDIRLLTAGDLATLFPETEIWREKLGPLTKSLVAVR